MNSELSICIITCNDEAAISDCLSRLEGCEVIVADLGSHDHTVAIARQQGATVFEIDWNHDFSEVKNFCMEQVGGRWVLFLQVDEVISLEELRPLLKNPNAEAYLMTIDYNSASFQVASPVQALRLVRVHKDNRFCGRSFEQIPDEALTGVVDARVQIKRQVDAMISWELPLRFELLQQEVLQNPGNGYLQYMQGLMLLNLNKLEECIACFEAAISQINIGYLYAPHLYKCLGFAYLLLERSEDAMRVLSEGIEYFPFYSDIFMLRAELYQQLGQQDCAIQDLLNCQIIREHPNLTVPLPEIGNAYIHESLGDIYLAKRRDLQALSCYLKSYELDHSDGNLLHKLLELIKSIESSEALDNLLRITLDHEEPLANFLDWLIKGHEYAFVLSHLDDISPVLGNEYTKTIETVCRLMIGEPIDIDAANVDDGIMLRLVELSWFGGDMQQAAQLIAGMKDERNQTLCHLIQSLLTENPAVMITEFEYDMVKMIHDDFLWRGQPQKARLLLPLLLPAASGERCIALAGSWAALGDLDAIAMILQYTGEEKPVFISGTIEKLLLHGHTTEACYLKSLGGEDLPERLEKLIWAAALCDKLSNWAKGLDIPRDNSPQRPDNELIEFYRIRFGDSDGDNVIDSKNVTVSELHEKIGDAYMQLNNADEALSAYTWALHTDHYNFSVQKKLLGLIVEDPLRSEKILLDGWAEDCRLRFIQGLEYFHGGRFSNAYAIFNSIPENKEACAVFRAYSEACSWLDGMGDEIDWHSIPDEAIKILHICLDYIHSYLRKYESSSLARLLLERASAIKIQYE